MYPVTFYWFILFYLVDVIDSLFKFLCAFILCGDALKDIPLHYVCILPIKPESWVVNPVPSTPPGPEWVVCVGYSTETPPLAHSEAKSFHPKEPNNSLFGTISRDMLVFGVGLTHINPDTGHIKGDILYLQVWVWLAKPFWKSASSDITGGCVVCWIDQPTSLPGGQALLIYPPHI